MTRVPEVGSVGGIATTYNGQRFRSRLEAKYAALFDLCELRWEYECWDLGTPDSGYTPDFLLLPDAGSVLQLLVEVKPLAWIHRRAEHGAWPDAAPEALVHLARARAAGWRGAFAVLGATLGPVVGTQSSLGVSYAALGADLDLAAHDASDERPEVLCLNAAAVASDAEPGKFILECAGGWGTWGSKNAPHPTSRYDWVETMWRFAANRVQWNRR